jgi:hypothetical protein
MERLSEPTMIDRVALQQSSPKEVLPVYNDLPDDSMRDAVDKAVAKHNRFGANLRHEWTLVGLAVTGKMGFLSRKRHITQIKVYLQRIHIK